jgi:hypothetical protein
VLFDADDGLTYDEFKERVRTFYRRSILKNARPQDSALNTNVKFQGKCHRCGMMGHRIRDCKNAAAMVCRKCNKKGHIAKFCKQKQEDSEEANMADEDLSL